MDRLHCYHDNKLHSVLCGEAREYGFIDGMLFAMANGSVHSHKSLPAPFSTSLFHRLVTQPSEHIALDHIHSSWTSLYMMYLHELLSTVTDAVAHTSLYCIAPSM